jgi:alpha-galactosidase
LGALDRRLGGLHRRKKKTVASIYDFRGLRTIPFVLDLAGEMPELCPKALLLNYTNPMSILMEALYTASPETKSVGLCHSVPYTAREIAS